MRQRERRSSSQVRALAELPLFGACPGDELGTVGRLGTEVVVAEGTVIARRGTTCREFVVVLGGYVRQNGPDGTRVLQPGDHAGLEGLLGSGVWTSAIVAASQARLLVFDARTLSALLERCPSVARRLMRHLAIENGRLRADDPVGRVGAATG